MMEANRYYPTEDGWRIRIAGQVLQAGESDGIGVCLDDPRKHARPIYPGANRGIFEGKAPAHEVERLPMRPVVVAYNGVRFDFDFHHAGGMVGTLEVGVWTAGGEGLWLGGAEEILVKYAGGQVAYEVSDRRLPGVRVCLEAIPTASGAGAVLGWRIEGAKPGTQLVFAFTPTKKEKVRISSESDAFVLRQRYDPPVPGGTNLSKSFVPTGWEAEVRGLASVQARWGLCEDARENLTVGHLLQATAWADAERTSGRMVMRSGADAGDLVVGMGQCVREPIGKVKADSEARLASVGNRVIAKTPDPYLNATVSMMAFGLEGIWGDLAYLHGAWSWRFAYLGWRTWYGPNLFGWQDRVREAIGNHIRFCLFKEGDDKGGIGSIIEFDVPVVYYNMNEVFLDMVRHYYDHTNDLVLIREIYGVLEGVVAWENRRLRPTEEPLYENSLNTWISDAHWAIRGQGTQASAYMFNAHRLMARLAGALGKDATAWEAQADCIREAMQQKLWQKRAGVFAECQDTLGHKMLHPEPELPTIYHSAEFGAADPLQVYQMLHWADTHLVHEKTAYGGMQVWSSNWHPNQARSYTHSTYELAFAESLNYALTNYLAGRSEEGWALIAGTLCGVFSGVAPGGLSCHAARDGRQRRNEEFADTMSMWCRAVLEGLFGIGVNRPEEMVTLSPGFPKAWEEASIETPEISYSWQRQRTVLGVRERLSWESKVATRVKVRLAVKARRLVDVSAIYQVAAGVGLTWVEVLAPKGHTGEVEVTYEPAEDSLPGEAGARRGEAVPGLPAGDVVDPQGILSTDGRVAVDTAGGPGVVFVKGGGEGCPVMVPWRVNVKDGKDVQASLWMSTGFAGESLERWRLVDMSGVFNAPVMEVLKLVLAASKPPVPPASGINFEYMSQFKSDGYLRMSKPEFKPAVSDGAWRGKVGVDGVAWTGEGIPFKSPREGNNIAVATLAGGFPEAVSVPVGQEGKTIYLMISGATWPPQSHVVNLRVGLKYEDGVVETHNLVNPTGIGDCWDTFLGWFHDTPANGFESLGGRYGMAGSHQVRDMTQPIETDTEAHLIAYQLRPGKRLASVTLEAIANDAVFGLMGLSIRV